MSRTVLTVVALVAITLLGFGIYSNVSQRSATPSPTAESNSDLQTDVQAQSLADFIDSANNQQCTFTDTEAETSGTIYVANGQLRGDFTSSAEGESVVAHVISNNQEVYLWMDGVDEAYQTSMDSISELSGELPLGDLISPDDDVDYECSPWAVDPAVFELPDKNFTDLSTLLEAVGGSENNALQCAACDSLSGEVQMQCRAALSCN